jgi:RNA recognition motif-containing protein
MSTQLLVANFPTNTRLWDLYTLFTAFGEVEDVTIRMNRRAGRRWALVEMEETDEAKRALAQLDGLRWNGSRLRVSEAPLEGRPAPLRAED